MTAPTKDRLTEFEAQVGTPTITRHAPPANVTYASTTTSTSQKPIESAAASYSIGKPQRIVTRALIIHDGQDKQKS